VRVVILPRGSVTVARQPMVGANAAGNIRKQRPALQQRAMRCASHGGFCLDTEETAGSRMTS
jgi:hypothetical protein